MSVSPATMPEVLGDHAANRIAGAAGAEHGNEG